MDYIGSKLKLCDWIFDAIVPFIPAYEWETTTFLDACAGSGFVTKYAMDQKFGKIISNDILSFSSCMINGYISMRPTTVAFKINDYMQTINELEGVEGFFYKNYSETSGRSYFTDANAKRIDAVRQYIATITDTRIKNYLLYCGLEALSRVINTTGIQAAFLKQIKDRASQPYLLETEDYSLDTHTNVLTFNQDVLELLRSPEYRKNNYENVLYLDPPYNQRQYGPNYHIYETYCKYDNPTIGGKTGLREYDRSPFCSKKTCIDYFRDVINASTARVIMISYNSDGLLTADEIQDMILQNCSDRSVLHSRVQKRYKADNSRQNDESLLKEYLFIFERE